MYKKYDNDLMMVRLRAPCTIKMKLFNKVSQIEGVREYFVTEPTPISSTSHLELILKDDIENCPL